MAHRARRALAWLVVMAGLLAGLGSGPLVCAASPLAYTLVIMPTGDAAIDQAIRDASQLAGLRERAPVGPFALLARAESDAVRFDTVLRSFGYYDGRIQIRIAGRAIDDPTLFPVLEDRPAGSPVKVAVNIASGPLYRLGIVRLDGPVPADVRAAFNLKSGDPARAAAVLAAGEAVLQALREDGFALAQVPPPDALVDHDTRRMDVVYLAEPGPRVTLGSITINGLTRLREDYVRRRLDLQPGEPFSPARLEAARRDLLADGVLAWARLTPGTVPDAEGRLPLTLDVAERPLRVVRLAGAFSSDEGTTGSAAWTHRNLFGGAEQLTLRADLGQVTEGGPQAASYLVNGSLRIPDRWLRDLALRLDLGAVNESLEAYDREAVTAGAVLERRFSEQLSGSAGLAFERSRVTQEDDPRDYRLLSLPLTLTYDTTDDPLNPRRGLRLTAQAAPTQHLGQELARDGPGFVRGRLAGSAYLDLGDLLASAHAGPSSARIGTGQSVLAGRLVLGSILGAVADQVPPDWRFYAGGGGSVRGYPFQSIGPRTPSGTPAGGDGLFEASLEWRRRFGANWGLAMFLDAGAVSATGTPDADGLAVGLGLGVRYHTPIGPVRADIATPLNPHQGDSPLQLYIGIGQAF